MDEVQNIRTKLSKHYLQNVKIRKTLAKRWY